MEEGKPDALKEFRRIPGVGKSIAQDLWDLGLRRVDDLRGGDPQALYERLCELRGTHVDRCMLYVLRCAVYFASSDEHDPEKLLWWNWKDSSVPQPRRRTVSR
ncbi:MAG TPA: helix-hairpin-helix domain-containing protein [Longimicrobiaceae bacterium]